MTAPAWVPQVSGTNQQLNHVYGFGPLLAIAVGNAGTILRWNGVSWSRRYSGVTGNLYRVWGPSSASIWAVGDNGALLNSTDGGLTWVANTSLGVATVALGSSPYSLPANYGVWGVSSLDFWVLASIPNGGFGQGEALIWHTPDGGNSWVLVGAPNGNFQSLWGVTAAAGLVGPQVVFAGLGVTGGGPGVSGSVFQRYGGPAPATAAAPSAALAQSIFDGTFAFPYGSAMFAIGPYGATNSSGVIQRIGLGFTGPTTLDAIPPVIGVISHLYGASDTTLYAAGQSYTGANGLLLQVTGPVQPPGTQTQWGVVSTPSGAAPTGGFLGVYSDGSGYAVAVGSAGAIVARPAAVLSVLGALAIATNTVQVTLSSPPIAQSVIGNGDALNPASWSIVRSDTGQQLTVLSISQVGPAVFNVVVAERFASSLVQHTVSASAADAFGNAIMGPTSASFAGVVSDTNATTDAQTASRNYVLSDLANPPFPNANGIGGGTRVITPAGDFGSESGNAMVTKLILRRLGTPLNGFFHLPGYGLGLQPKMPVKTSDMPTLKKLVQEQVLMEPEVLSANVVLTMDEENEILSIAIAGTTNTGQGFSVKTQISTNTQGS